MEHVFRTFNEVFEICMLITEAVADLRSCGDSEISKSIESGFTRQQNILAVFARQFDHRLIYDLEDSVVRAVELRQIMVDIKKTVIDYEGLAARIKEDYKEMVEYMKDWWKTGTKKSSNEDPGKSGSREKRERLEAAKIRHPGNIKFTFAPYDWDFFRPERLEELIEDLTTSVKELVEFMKFTFLLHFCDDAVQLKRLKNEVGILRFSHLLEKRLFILNPSEGEPASQFGAGVVGLIVAQSSRGHDTSKSVEPRLLAVEIGGMKVLLEYKRYRRHNIQRIVEETAEQIRFLSQLLSAGGSPITGRSFLSYFHEPEKYRFGLVFCAPPGLNESTPLSLHRAITSLPKAAQPTLGQRFEIAYTIGFALTEWFLIGCTHKSISSHNIFFVREDSESDWDNSSLFVGGYDFDRPVGEVVNAHFDHEDFTANIYRHPERQGLPSKEAKFEKIHDIYAFGVLLLEIGMWTVCQELLRDETLSPEAIRDVFIETARVRLGPSMGQRYRDAVLHCLEGTFEVEDDDEQETELINDFKKEVLDVCAQGKCLL